MKYYLCSQNLYHNYETVSFSATFCDGFFGFSCFYCVIRSIFFFFHIWVVINALHAAKKKEHTPYQWQCTVLDTIICIRLLLLLSSSSSSIFCTLCNCIPSLCALHNVFTTHFNVGLSYTIYNIYIFVRWKYSGEWMHRECNIVQTEREKRQRRKKILRHYWKMWSRVVCFQNKLGKRNYNDDNSSHDNDGKM